MWLLWKSISLFETGDFVLNCSLPVKLRKGMLQRSTTCLSYSLLRLTAHRSWLSVHAEHFLNAWFNSRYSFINFILTFILLKINIFTDLPSPRTALSFSCAPLPSNVRYKTGIPSGSWGKWESQATCVAKEARSKRGSVMRFPHESHRLSSLSKNASKSSLSSPQSQSSNNVDLIRKRFQRPTKLLRDP